MPKWAKKHGADITLTACVVILVLSIGYSGWEVTRFTVIAAIFGPFIIHFKSEAKRTGFLIGFAILAIIATLAFPTTNISTSDGTVLHTACNSLLTRNVKGEIKSVDTDGDRFSSKCEEGTGDDNDATKVPVLKGLANIAPSINSPYRREKCQIPSTATRIKIYHAGMVGRSIKSYRINIPEKVSLPCNVKDEDRKQSSMECVFADQFLNVFQSLDNGEFEVKIQVSTVEPGEIVSFPITCTKI